MAAKINRRQYVIVIKPRKFNIAHIKCFTVVCWRLLGNQDSTLISPNTKVIYKPDADHVTFRIKRFLRERIASA